jgi:hypothetical protein
MVYISEARGMRLELEWDEKEYAFDLDEMSVGDLKVIKDHCGGLTLLALRNGCALGDADALRAAFWYMKTSAGESFDIDRDNFKVVKFYNLTQAAIDAATKDDGDPKGEAEPDQT